MSKCIWYLLLLW